MGTAVVIGTMVLLNGVARGQPISDESLISLINNLLTIEPSTTVPEEWIERDYRNRWTLDAMCPLVSLSRAFSALMESHLVM